MDRKTIILRHFTRYKFISSMQAFELYGITRLSAVIYNLRKKGYKIETVWRTTVNRYGKEVHYKDYFLVKKDRKWFSKKQ